MKTPELLLRSTPEDDFLDGGCSLCPSVRFHLTGNTLERKELLRRMFDAHLRTMHLRPDATIPNQAPEVRKGEIP
jgi:hypothetical protein